MRLGKSQDRAAGDVVSHRRVVQERALKLTKAELNCLRLWRKLLFDSFAAQLHRRRHMIFGWNWLRRPREFNAIHPEWRVGQYVTYLLELSDSSWTAFAIRIVARTDDGAWILQCDFKTPLGESTTWFRSDPHAKAEDFDPFPVREELVRGSHAETQEQLPEDPLLQSSLAANLLLVRRHSNAVAALRGRPRPVQHPCGIDYAHRFSTPGPGYEKHHDLNPRVMVTGVACSSINNGQKSIVATSFGFNDPSDAEPTSYDDFVDLAHCKAVRHEGFSLSYPATCFLRLEGSRLDRGTTVDDYSALYGGMTCSYSLTLSIRRGARDQLTEIRRETLARLADPNEGPMGRLVPQSPVRRLHDGQDQYLFRLEDAAIDGLAHSAVLLDSSETTLAQVHVFGCVAKANPRRQSTLRQMGDVFPAIINSFQFVTSG
jgi:hypothetical protein